VEGYGIEKSSVSRQFVAASCLSAGTVRNGPRSLNLVVLMIDGIHFGGQCWWWLWGSRKAEKNTCSGVVAKEPRRTPRWSGLLEDLVDRGLHRQRRYLVVIDGSKALTAGVERVFGE